MASIGSSDAAGTSSPFHQEARRRRNKKSQWRVNMKPQGTPFAIIKLDDLEPVSDIQIQIENYSFLASYNWTKAKEPTIFIPGAPPIWKPLKPPITIPKDNAKARKKQSSDPILAPSFAPFFAALLTMQPSYSLLPISLVTDRNSLRKLLDFASGRPQQDWRIYVELVEETLFLIRWEEDKRKVMTGSLNSGYGHSFEEAFVKFENGLQNSCAHHRIVEYEIGCMKWVVRFEADGYLEHDRRRQGTMTVGSSQPEPNLATTMESLSLGAEYKPSTLEGVAIIKEGHLVPPESIIEIKSKNSTANIRQLGAKKIPQCWFSQTKRVFLGLHKDGLIDREPVEIDMSSSFEAWEKSQQNQLGKLITIIRKISEVARQMDGGKCCLFCDRKEKPRALSVFNSNENGLMLSAEVKERYWRN